MQGGIIEAIYDAPLASQPWTGLPKEIRRAFGCSAAMLTFARTGATGTKTQSVYDTAWDSRDSWPLYDSIYRHLDPINCLPMRTGNLYDYDALTLQAGDADIERFIRYVKTLGAQHGLFVHLGKHGGADAWLSLSRDAEEGGFGEADMGAIRSLLPHLQRAVEIHCRLEGERNSAAMHAAALADLGIGAVLLDESGAILGSNAVADSVLDQRRALSREGGRLNIIGGEEHLQRTLSRTGEGQIILAGERGDHPLHLLVRPWKAAPALGIGPAYAVYFETEAAELRVEALRRRFDLSHAEARFAALLVAGKSVDDAGADSGLTRASARTYCKRIFARMGVRSQSELVRLVLTSVARLDQ